jgi:hypothetical protein
MTCTIPSFIYYKYNFGKHIKDVCVGWMSDAQGIAGKEITVELVECSEDGGKTVRETVTRRIDGGNTIQEVVRNHETGVYPAFPGACVWVLLRKPGSVLGELNPTDVVLWDRTVRGARLWTEDWYDRIQAGDTVEIHVGIARPAGPRSAGRGDEEGVALENRDEGRHIDRGPGGPHEARLARLLAELLDTLK